MLPHELINADDYFITRYRSKRNQKYLMDSFENLWVTGSDHTYKLIISHRRGRMLIITQLWMGIVVRPINANIWGGAMTAAGVNTGASGKSLLDLFFPSFPP